MRNYYSQFGLGVKTGIDLPQESAGMQTTPDAVGGLILDLAIGQYDTYTPSNGAVHLINCQWRIPYSTKNCY